MGAGGGVFRGGREVKNILGESIVEIAIKRLQEFEPMTHGEGYYVAFSG